MSTASQPINVGRQFERAIESVAAYMPLSPGSRLGPYEIVAPIGAGGMGQVYRARDRKLDRDVAIKVLPESLANDEDALSRFEREAKAVAALSHPNILSIFDFGSEDGVAYAVMELLEGQTLRARLDTGPISQKQAVDYALQIAKGLSAAHDRGVVHRDLKPENLFVSQDGHVKILDFGLAKKAEATSADGVTSGPTVVRTEPGIVMGTIGYMSPEQVRGLPVDHRSDIFSFGTILYELLTGRRAFRKDTASDTMAAIMRDEPADLSESGRNISPVLDHIVRHCLEKSRENRFQSAKDIAFALSEPSSGFTGGAAWVEPPRARTRKVLYIGAGAILLLALAAIGLWQRQRSSVGGVAGLKRVAVLPFENQGAAEDDYFADGMGDEVRGKLTALSGVEVIARASSTPYRKTNKTPQQIAQELGVTYLLTATVRWQKGTEPSRVHVTPELVEVTTSGAPASRWQQRFDAGLTDVFQMQSEIATRVAQSLGVVLGAAETKRLAEKPTQNLAAYDALLKGEAASNAMAYTDPASMRSALKFYERAVALDPSLAKGWARVSSANTMLYANSAPTPELSERARAAAEKTITLAPEAPEGYMALGNYHRLVLNDFKGALEQYEQGRRRTPGSGPLLAATALADQGLGKWEHAVEHLRQAERLDPRSVAIKRILGMSLLRMRRYPEARAALDRALALAPTNLDAIQYKAMTFVAEGNEPAARAIFAEAAKTVDATALVAYFANYWGLGWLLDEHHRQLLLRLTPSAFDDDRAQWAIVLAQACALNGDQSGARRYAEEARKALEEQLRAVPQDPDRHVSLGNALAILGRKEDAVREGARGVALDSITKDAYGGPWVQQEFARILVVVGEPEKALDQLEPLLKISCVLSPGWLAVDPAFAPLRSNPRFQKLVASTK